MKHESKLALATVKRKNNEIGWKKEQHQIIYMNLALYLNAMSLFISMKSKRGWLSLYSTTYTKR